ncbi:MAG: ABC transporter permease, partial [Candidatus Dormiibacterota bacterium]
WGAPLIARELESGTYRLAWTQSVTHTRWLAVKVGVIGLASMAVAGLLSLMVTWWSALFDRVALSPFATFDERDIVPIAYAALGFALGVTVGVLIRRTVPAMAITAVAFVAIRLAVVLWVRPNFAPARHLKVPDTLYLFGRPSTGSPNPSDWITSVQTVNRAGRVIGQNGFIPGSGVRFAAGGHGITVGGVGSCPDIRVPLSPGQAGFSPGPYVERCFNQLGIHDVLTYQPASRYWAFQWYELAIFIALALLLVGLCFWWVRHRLA